MGTLGADPPEETEIKSLKIFECSKCKSKDVFIKKSGNNTGLYCGDCGAWIKWLNKTEIRLVQRQIEMNKKKLDEFIESLQD